LSPDGTFRDIVLSKHDGVDKPLGITFNNDFTKLFIINGGGKTVLVYSSTKYKNPSFTKNIKILHLPNIKILYQQNIKILHLQKI
jgi:hypothetical protein